MHLPVLTYAVILNCVVCYFGAAVHVSSDSTPFFRNDYIFNEETQNFYKFHSIRKNWADAVERCELEGAKLFVPETQLQRDIVMKDFVEKNIPENSEYPWVWLGMHDRFSEGDFVTTDGRSIDEVFVDWNKDDPNNFEDNEDCVVMKRTGKMYDIDCEKTKAVYICQKSRRTLEWNHLCNIPDTKANEPKEEPCAESSSYWEGSNKKRCTEELVFYFVNPPGCASSSAGAYIYNKELGKCHKLHLNPKNWQDAYAACNAEQSYLAIVNSQAEFDYYKNMCRAKKDARAGDSITCYLGFHNLFRKGWQSIKGQRLEDTGYAVWGANQPDGTGEELCGTMIYEDDGPHTTIGLNDFLCTYTRMFMCEHDIDYLASDYDERFNNLNNTSTS